MPPPSSIVQISRTSTTRLPRTSVFRETGLLDQDLPIALLASPVPRLRKPTTRVRFGDAPMASLSVRGESSIHPVEPKTGVDATSKDWEASLLSSTELQPTSEFKDATIAKPSKLFRLGLLTLLLVVVLPIAQHLPVIGRFEHALFGVHGGVIDHGSLGTRRSGTGALSKRADSPTDVCTRWSQATALVNGTLYIYGGEATTSSSQTSNTWNNDFLKMDLTSSWQISSPSMTGLPQPSGPPNVSLAYLWSSRTSLYLYGGEFQDGNDGNTADYPTAFSLWEYDIFSSSWTEHSNPTTSAGDNAAEAGQKVQRAAEGAGVDVPQIGRGFYFGGHLDEWTTEDWSNQIPRVYLKSLVEYTFPGYSNNGIQSLSDGTSAGQDGAWRNVTEGGLQTSDGFPERADGILVYIPGFGEEGILLGLAGGTNSTFTQMNVIDVYDIANSTWYKQPTSGSTPKIRVNPCAVVAAAADGSSYNMYMFGGQNLGDDQTQYQDMWILSVPSFTWLEVDQSSQSVPYARAGHTCNIWDGQMVVVGGYVGTELSCDSPGIYVFNTSSLEWGTQFTSLSGNQSAASSDGSFSGSSNPFSQQLSQRGSNSTSGLEGSYGYSVPEEVISVIGGSGTGGATVTAPVQAVTAGPMATGKPITYTVTGAGGTITTETASPGSSGGTTNSGGGGGGTNIGAIVAGVIAGLLAVVAGYLAFCAWVYRKQLQLYKNHVAMAQAAAADPAKAEKQGFVMPESSKNSSEAARKARLGVNSENGSSTVAQTPGASGSGGSSGAPNAAALSDGVRRNGSSASSTEDLLGAYEPSFWGSRGVLLNPRRSLRVINRD